VPDLKDKDTYAESVKMAKLMVKGQRERAKTITSRTNGGLARNKGI